MRTTLLLLAMVLLVPLELVAQEAPPIAAGDRVRIKAPSIDTPIQTADA